MVVRARSIHLFPEPALGSTESSAPLYASIARHSFGWVDSVAVSVNANPNSLLTRDVVPFEPLSILIRPESDDPWTSDVHTLDLYTLEPNPAFSLLSPSSNGGPSKILPYVFPPSLSSQVPTIRGSLRCTDIILGRYGTALWIRPQDRSAAGLISPDVHLQEMPPPDSPAAHESLVATVFPGPLKPSESKNSVQTLWRNSFNNWTSMDYDEVLGRIALGSSFGRVTILEL